MKYEDKKIGIEPKRGLLKIGVPLIPDIALRLHLITRISIES